MREILFRGKKTNNEEWAYGFYQEYPKGYVHIQNDSNDCFPVIPETICQYTGLTDKNGKKIFEGDIINDIDYGIMKCIYLHGSFVWYKEDGFKIECMKYVPVIEVIGNIFDNPELIGDQP